VPDPGASAAAREDEGSRLAAQEGRLRLLLAHLAGRAVRARVEIDDLVQEVWMRLLTHGGGLPPPDSGDERLWARTRIVARHAVVDAARAIRSQKRSGKVVRLARSEWSRAGAGNDARESRIPQPGSGPATRAAGAEDHRRILEAFERLTPEHRRVIGLRQGEGLSARETSARMGRGEAAVHSLFRRALAAWEQEISGGIRGESGREPRPPTP
jgi:RNA polymerase sigma factor (sigma-70 family)